MSQWIKWSVISGEKKLAPSAPCRAKKAKMLAFVSSSCQGMEGSDVCVGDVAGCSERSNFFGRKWPRPTLCTQGVGNFVDVITVASSSSFFCKGS